MRGIPEDKFERLYQEGTLNPASERVTDNLFLGDFFDSHDLAQVMYEMLRRVALQEQSISEAIREFGFSSRNFFYLARDAFEGSGLAGLVHLNLDTRKRYRVTRKVFHCIRQIRKENPSMPITELTERVGQCLRLNVREVSIRRALVRIDASTRGGPKTFACDDLRIDFETREVRVGDRNVHLTPTQFELLRYLVSRAGTPVTHRELLQFVWGDDFLPQVEYVRVFMNQLRKKIEPDPANPRYLRTEPCIGYCFVPSSTRRKSSR
jgi:DNA-binding winged helix-turn-helix (wHTH) protein